MEISGYLIPQSDGSYKIHATCDLNPSPTSVYDRASTYIENNDVHQLKQLHSISKIDFSEFNWELGYNSVDKPKILRYICKHSDFVKSEGWHILVTAVRRGNTEAMKFLVNECHIDPDELRSVAFVNDEYNKLASQADLPCI